MVKQVAFNDEQYKIFEDLKVNGFTSQEFSEFVKTAFYDRLDDLKARRLDLSQATISKLAFEAVQAETKKALSKN